MTFKTQLLSLLLAFSLQTLYAQNTGFVNFNIYPGDAVVKINDVLYEVKEQNEVKLTEGTHHIQIWAPRLEILHDTIEITAGKTLQYTKGLKVVNEDYRQFQVEQKRYFNKKVVNISRDVIIVGANIAATAWVLKKSSKFKKSKDTALNSKLGYESAIFQNEIDLKRIEYESNKDDFEKKQKNHNLKRAVGIPILAISYGASIYHFIKRKGKKPVKPVYEVKNPFVSTVMKLNPNVVYQNNEFYLNLSYNF